MQPFYRLPPVALFLQARTECATDTTGHKVCRISRHHRRDLFDLWGFRASNFSRVF